MFQLRTVYFYIVSILVFAGLGNVLFAQKTVILLGGDSLPKLTDAEGASLDSGYQVWIGAFDSGFDPVVNAEDLVALMEHWHTFAETKSGSLAGETGSFVLRGVREEVIFDGKTIYLWAFRTMDGGTPKADLSNVVEYGLFTGASSQWRFPRTGAQPPYDLKILKSSEVTSVLYGDLGSGNLALKRRASVPAWKTHIAQWQENVFHSGIPTTARELLADPDGDGVLNLVEYASGRDPLTYRANPVKVRKPSSSELQTLEGRSSGIEQRLVIEYSKRKDFPEGVLFEPQYSHNLVDWYPLNSADAVIVSETEEAWEFEQTLAFAEEKQAFFRIRVATQE